MRNTCFTRKGTKSTKGYSKRSELYHSIYTGVSTGTWYLTAQGLLCNSLNFWSKTILRVERVGILLARSATAVPTSMVEVYEHTGGSTSNNMVFSSS
jgi:hypothetical protein